MKRYFKSVFRLFLRGRRSLRVAALVAENEDLRTHLWGLDASLKKVQWYARQQNEQPAYLLGLIDAEIVVTNAIQGKDIEKLLHRAPGALTVRRESEVRHGS